MSEALERLEEVDSRRQRIINLSLLVKVDVGTDGPEDPLTWPESALCAQTDPEAFFPEKGTSTRDAKKVCAGCVVRLECLDDALRSSDRFGVWGGLSERERRKLKRRII